MKLIDNPKILDCHFKNGMMILPYYHSIIVARLNKQSFSGEGMRKAPLRKRLWSLLKGLRYCQVKRKDILIFSSTLFNVQKDRRFFNYLHGYYYDLYPNNTLLIEDGDTNYMWRTNDSCESLSFINTYIEIFSQFLQKICHTIKPIHYKDYKIVVSQYPDLLSEEILSKDDYYTRFYAFFITKLFERARPKVVFVNCASYGHNGAIICYVAKHMGIKVIEPQHGVTYKCPGYITSDVVSHSQEYHDYLPDALFTFGDYWNEFVDWKYDKVSVGYQYLNEYVSRIGDNDMTHDFLIISQPMIDKEEAKNKIQFVKSLAQTFPDCRVLFRIHPSENYAQQKEIYKACSNIEISNSTSVLYEDINRSKFIIGWFSNCLYECLAFKRVPIIIETKYTREVFPRKIGIWVKSVDDLKNINFNEVQRTDDYSEFWTTDFENKVRKYLDQVL